MLTAQSPSRRPSASWEPRRSPSLLPLLSPLSLPILLSLLAASAGAGSRARGRGAGQRGALPTRRGAASPTLGFPPRPIG